MISNKPERVIRDFAPSDEDAIGEIYNQYIAGSIATFEEQTVSGAEIAGRVQQSLSAGLPYIVAESNGAIVGYACAGKWRNRSAYRFAAEVSVYLDENAIGRGHGTALYEELFRRLQKSSCRVAIAGISLPNVASVRLHEKFGMRKVAHFAQVGFKFEQWIDVGYWQLFIADDNTD